MGAHAEAVRVMGGGVPPLEENVDLLEFTPERAHILLRVVYGDCLYHTDGSYLDRVVTDDAIWKRHWRRLAVQLAGWYATPYGTVGIRFTAILAAEWCGVLGRSLKSKRPLVFSHVVLTKTLGVHRAK